MNKRKKTTTPAAELMYAIEGRDLYDPKWKVSTVLFKEYPHPIKAVYPKFETARQVMKEWIEVTHMGMDILVRARQQYRIRTIVLLPGPDGGAESWTFVSPPRYVGSVEARKKIPAAKVKKS